MVKCRFLEGQKVQEIHGEGFQRFQKGPLSFQVEWVNQGELQFLRVDAETSALITLLALEINATWTSEQSPLFFANGYQSWTHSQLCHVRSRQHQSQAFVRRLFPQLALDCYGDEGFVGLTPQKGVVWGYTLGYFTHEGSSEIEFFGSLNENLAFTRVLVDFNSQTLTLQKDVEGLRLMGRQGLFDMVRIHDEKFFCFRRWYQLLSLPPSDSTTLVGWTSWYYYYQNISEKILLENLEAISHAQIPLDVFQIDDGYQRAVGDWFDLKPEFPRGMGYLAQQIHDKGYKAGLWIAPLAAQTTSKLAQHHPEWLVLNKVGKPLIGGGNWSGFYVLDILKDEVQHYLRHVFEVMTQAWQYDLFKVDFLYASCLIPRQGLSRAQIMALTMDYLRQITQGKELLACGVPLASALGKADSCRIGTDVEARWSRPIYETVLHSELPSTRRAIDNMINRLPLHGLGFRNDPDVFFLRKELNRLSPTERHSLFLLTYLLGGVWMTSDPIHKFDTETLTLYRSGFPKPFLNHRESFVHKGLWQGKFEVKGLHYLWAYNPNNQPLSWLLPPGLFSPSSPCGTQSTAKLELIQGPKSINLAPHQTQLFLEVRPWPEQPVILGSVGHILPGIEVVSFRKNSHTQNLEVEWEGQLQVPVWLWVGYFTLGQELPTLVEELRRG